MRYFIIILLLAGCAKTASQSATEVALNQVDAVEQTIKKECPQAKIDKDMDALRSSINSQLSTCEVEQARIQSDKIKWQLAFWCLAIVMLVFFLKKD
jgi:hypothetical protein